ncbi:MAG: molybdopterin synthase sulfur carrier subunit [Rhodospirillaceae bacterium]|nr:MAG: molybdopterin synthase sulfur carrier subunit [Rhodospirillaceae bacterium]
MKILYFARVKTSVGLSEEEMVVPADITTVAGLIGWLRTCTPGHAAAFVDLSVIRVAVNQEHVGFDHPVSPADEVAFFPPITGGLH